MHMFLNYDSSLPWSASREKSISIEVLNNEKIYAPLEQKYFTDEEQYNFDEKGTVIG